jgi:ubiquinone/menaquinone biosynthesis C-methylase UbiE
MADRPIQINQCSKPAGWSGRLSLWRMNLSHSKVTDWGLAHVSIANHSAILDVGCGGGRTVGKLAAIATHGKVYGVDYSDASVAATRKANAHWIAEGRVDVRHASVSELPFPDGTFDLVTAVETHFWWSDMAGGMREIHRVLKPGGTLLLIAEVYKGASSLTAGLVEKYASQTGMALLTVDEHRDLFAAAGFSNVRIVVEAAKGWICGISSKPVAGS